MNLKRLLWSACLGGVTSLMPGCAKTETVEQLAVVVEGDQQAKVVLSEVFGTDPFVRIPGSGTKYHIQIIEPNESIDYKIIQINPMPPIEPKVELNEGEHYRTFRISSDSSGNCAIQVIEASDKGQPTSIDTALIEALKSKIERAPK